MSTDHGPSRSESLRHGLEAASKAADEEVWDDALRILRRHRDQALDLGDYGALLEALPVAIRVEPWEPFGVQEYLRASAMALSSTGWGEQYEREQTELQTEGLYHRRKRVESELMIVAVSGAFFGLIGAGLLIFSAVADEDDRIPWSGFGLLGSAILAGFYCLSLLVKRSYISAEIERLGRRARVNAAFPISSVTDDRTEGQYFTNLVKINVTNLGDYYTLVKVHTNNSFRASLLAGALGFTLIIIGLSVGFVGDKNEAIAYLATASGVLIEFISGVFFYLYNRTVRQLKEYHDSLLDVQNILLAFKIVEDSEPVNREQLLKEILAFLLQRESQPTS
jgi:hypothetical protein